MRPSRMGLVVAVFLGSLAGGCSTTEGRCEDVCEYIDKCGLDPATNCADSCESDYDGASDKCQDAFDAWADCISEHDVECTDACDSDAVKWALDCEGQFD